MQENNINSEGALVLYEYFKCGGSVFINKKECIFSPDEKLCVVDNDNMNNVWLKNPHYPTIKELSDLFAKLDEPQKLNILGLMKEHLHSKIKGYTKE